MKKLSRFHPFLVALFPVLSLAASNAASVRISQVVETAVISLAGAALLWCALRLVFGDWGRAAVMTSATLVLFFSYGRLHNGSRELFLLRNRYLLPILGLLLAAAAWGLRKAKTTPRRLEQALTLAFGFLVLSSLARIAWSGWRSGGSASGREVKLPRTGPPASVSGLPGARAPDVYYIILDAYAGFQTLRDVYGLDNSGFLAALRARGFYVAEDSRSNYAQTPLSLASSTNMEYIGPQLEASGRRTKSLLPLFSMIEESRVMRAFQSRGYRAITFQSGWAVTARNRYADWDVNCGGWEEFSRTLAETTPLAALDSFQPIEKQSRDRVLCGFWTLGDIPRRVPGPHYVFAHFVFPEPPLLFGRNGEPVPRHSWNPAGQWKDRPGYVDQLLFANRTVLAAIDRILSGSQTPPIIVLQSDHGSASLADDWLYSDEGPPATGREPGIDPFLRERMGILNAYHLPRGPEGLYPSISPVNSFRLILDSYFGEHYPLLEDRSFFSRYAHPYWFVDVTTRVTAPSTARHP